ncbi:CASP-like protein 2D1 isoform X2 [Cicer arietinum]|uniref:CASP-like protein n=1 Tax=Cicer arietinum TaxID=3827 RepID=A0A1S2XSV0_CICAR|nr:CASP-like protein 2D1 isoform X2 [Cicer arietinum]
MSRTRVDETSSIQNHLPMLKLFDSSLRLCAVPLSLATVWITVTNNQDNTSYGTLRYSNFSGLKYMVYVSALCTCYAIVAAACSWVKYVVTKAWIFFISDQIVAYIIITSIAATMEIYYLAYNGAKEDSWSQACSSYGKFCRKVKLALILHMITFGCFFFLAVISAFRAFSVFDPPSVNSQDVLED